MTGYPVPDDADVAAVVVVVGINGDRGGAALVEL